MLRIFLLSCFLSFSYSAISLFEFVQPTINSSVETNYCIDGNNYEFLETMTVSTKSPRFLLFFHREQENGLFIESMNQLKSNARAKYGDNVAFINTTKVERNNLTLLFPVWHTKEVIISSDIIKYKD
tara:strand:+ start:197 stop:577 length:381 start_codon:yes stop_codon:yes gene_type:complete